MRGKIFVWISIIMLVSLFLFQCKNKPEKPATNQPPAVKTDDSIVFKELKKLPLYHKADSFYIADGYDSAIYYYNKTLSESKLPPNPIFKQEIFNRISYSYILLLNYKKADYYLSKALIFKVDKDTNLVNANTFYYLGVLNHCRNESDSALYYFHKAYKNYFRILGGSNLQIVKLNFQIGNVYRWIRFDYYNAEKYYYKALQIYEYQGFDKKDDQYFRILYFLASINRLKMDYDKALSYGIQALQLASTEKNHEKYIEISYALVANIYLLKDYYSSIEYFQKALDINSKSLKINNEYRSLYLINLAYANYKLANYKGAIRYSERAFKLINTSYPDSNQLSSCFEYLGNSYQELGEFAKAYKYYKLSLDIRLKYFGVKHPKTASAYGLIGKLYAYQQNVDSALHYYQLAIVSGSQKFNDLKTTAVPLLSESKENIDLIDILAYKASILKLKFQSNTKDFFSLKVSLRCYELIDSLVSLSRKSMDTEKSKLSFSTSSNELYAAAIDCAFQLYHVTKNDQYIQKAFQFFEKNKYLLLLEKLKMAEAANKAGVPDSLVEQERNLNAELKFVQDKLIGEQGKQSVNTLLLQALNAKIFSLMRSIEKLHGTFEQEYPNYFRIKYQDLTSNLESLQNYAIQKNTDVIQYFWGEKSIYVIGVSGSSLRFFRINNSLEFSDSLTSFIGMMHEANFTSKEKYREYVKEANYFFEKMVKPALVKTFSKKLEPQTLTIIPDGILSKLSFEALVTSLANSSKFSYKNLAYLVRQYNIEYAYSSNILLSNPTTNRRKFVNKLLGFGYSGNDQVSEKRLFKNSLSGTVDEMKAVSACFRSQIYLGLNASENNFKKNAPNYDVIHLALHGSADEEKESGSKLIFRTEKDTVDDGMLYGNEIYNLNLKAKLVVLSACETGIGKNYQGEGVFSLSRAFAYAGCPSIVISLWKVNDKSTATLMGNFYKHLSDGDEVGRSLHKAKLEYLEKSDEIGAQPVFWASFVAFGDMSPIKSKGNDIFWLVLSAIIVVGGFFVFRFALLKKLFKLIKYKHTKFY